MSADRAWSWPTIRIVRDLMAAVRSGFTVVKLPMPNAAAPSSEPRYALRRDGDQAPSIHMSGSVVAVALQRGLLTRDGDRVDHDGAAIFKLGPNAHP